MHPFVDAYIGYAIKQYLVRLYTSVFTANNSIGRGVWRGSQGVEGGEGGGGSTGASKPMTGAGLCLKKCDNIYVNAV